MSHLHLTHTALLEVARDLLTDAAYEDIESDARMEAYYETVSTLALVLGDDVAGTYAYTWAQVMKAAADIDHPTVESLLAEWDAVADRVLADA